MTIRRFETNDVQAVADLIAVTMRISNSADYAQDYIENIIQRMQPTDIINSASERHFYVAVDEDKVIGCGAIGPYWGRVDESSLFTIFVHPDYQRCGIGRQIIETLEQDEYALRARRIEVPASITGVQFYLKMGYAYKNGKAVVDDEQLYRLEKFREPDCQQPGIAAEEAHNAADTLMQVMQARHSYRGRYKPDRVPRDRLALIMQAGLAAPSGCNRQTTSLIAVDNPDLLQRVLSVIDPPIAVTAPAIICVLTNRANAYRDRCFATQDYAAAIENMLLMITALGYASCWYEGHITDTSQIGDRIAHVLNAPPEYELVCLLPVGVPDSPLRAPAKKDFHERAWFNQ